MGPMSWVTEGHRKECQKVGGGLLCDVIMALGATGIEGHRTENHNPECKHRLRTALIPRPWAPLSFIEIEGVGGGQWQRDVRGGNPGLQTQPAKEGRNDDQVSAAAS